MEGTGHEDSDPCRKLILDLYTRMQCKETRDETRDSAWRLCSACGFRGPSVELTKQGNASAGFPEAPGSKLPLFHQPGAGDQSRLALLTSGGGARMAFPLPAPPPGSLMARLPLKLLGTQCPGLLSRIADRMKLWVPRACPG
uniref:Uncharacterized protein n=1 Tax=Rangifer tarandus platyrhynchus TaxID=3082113 RepID=A0ACB0E8U0_RANTA|nr:unnamed protein product [Rangifer tarandus platyrhynchus]